MNNMEGDGRRRPTSGLFELQRPTEEGDLTQGVEPHMNPYVPKKGHGPFGASCNNPWPHGAEVHWVSSKVHRGM